MPEGKQMWLLKEHKIIESRLQDLQLDDKLFNIKEYKRLFRMVVVKYEDGEMEFDVRGIRSFLANTFRRIMLSDVPCMAIEKVYVNNNSSSMADDILAHRLGLIPLKADPRKFEFHGDDVEYSDTDSLEFDLKIRCTHKQEKSGFCKEYLYENFKATSGNIKWIPKGKQAEIFKKDEVGPVFDDITIAELKPGQEIDVKLIAVKGIGRDHAKFSPVSLATFRMLPQIKLLRPVEGEAALRLQSCFAPGVIDVVEENGKQVAKVENVRNDMSSRNIYYHNDLKEAVELSKFPDYFIFNIESTGAYKPDDIFREAIKILKSKCLSLLEELK